MNKTLRVALLSVLFSAPMFAADETQSPTNTTQSTEQPAPNTDNTTQSTEQPAANTTDTPATNTVSTFAKLTAMPGAAVAAVLAYPDWFANKFYINSKLTPILSSNPEYQKMIGRGVALTLTAAAFLAAYKAYVMYIAEEEADEDFFVEEEYN